MTAVLPRTRPATDPSPAPVPPPAPAPGARAFPAEPVDRRARYWDVDCAAWRPSPVGDGC
ncbi:MULTISPECIES: hypothetical protein [unclassified Blastococcus]